MLISYDFKLVNLVKTFELPVLVGQHVFNQVVMMLDNTTRAEYI